MTLKQKGSDPGRTEIYWNLQEDKQVSKNSQPEGGQRKDGGQSQEVFNSPQVEGILRIPELPSHCSHK